MEKISLQRITIVERTVRYDFGISEGLKKFFATTTFFIQYEHELKDIPISILSIPFVNCMAGLSWLSDAMLFIDELDETYYYSFKQLKAAYSELHRTELKGILVPSKIVQNSIKQSDDYLLLFGGGVDCHCSLLRHHDNISYLININGWLESESQINEVDESDRIKTKLVAEKFGIQSLHVRSNFASLFNLDYINKRFCSKLGTSYWYGFLHSMAFLSISVPISHSLGITNIMIASSFTKDKTDTHCGSLITTDSEFKYATNGRTLHDGYELNRQQKISLIVDYQRRTKTPYNLQACSFNDRNCCECEKCFRTVIEIIAEGAQPKDFGFNTDETTKDHWVRIINRDVGLWAIMKENFYYYQDSRKRMLDNYNNIQERDFVDWFLSFDISKAKRKGLYNYYRKNFYQILRRKLKL